MHFSSAALKEEKKVNLKRIARNYSRRAIAVCAMGQNLPNLTPFPDACGLVETFSANGRVRLDGLFLQQA